MHSDGGLRIDRTDDELIVQSEPTSAFTKWIGALFTGFALYWTIAWYRHDARSEVAYWLVFTFGMILIIVSVSLMFSRSVITIFDLRSQRALRSMNIFGWPYRTRVYSFAEIAGIGFVRGSKIDERDPMPVIALKNGTMLPLGTSNLNRFHVSDSGCAESIDAICTATSLQRCDGLRLSKASA
jgi:hypothetical protein